MRFARWSARIKPQMAGCLDFDAELRAPRRKQNRFFKTWPFKALAGEDAANRVLDIGKAVRARGR